MSTIETEGLTKHYGDRRGIEDGIDPLAFAGVLVATIAVAAFGSVVFGRRELPR